MLLVNVFRPSTSSYFLNEPALDGVTTVYLPTDEDALTCLFIGTDNTGEEASTFILVRFDPAGGKIPVIVFPKETAVLNNGKYQPIDEVFRFGGSLVVREALAVTLGVDIDRYVRMRRDAFITAAGAVGSVEFDLPTELTLDRSGTKMVLSPGKQLLDGQQAAEIIGSGAYKNGERERCRVTGELTSAIINQRMDICLSTVVDGVFEKIINIIATDITNPDYANRKPAAEYLARMQQNPACAIEAAGAYDSDGETFSLSDTFLARISQELQ